MLKLFLGFVFALIIVVLFGSLGQSGLCEIVYSGDGFGGAGILGISFMVLVVSMLLAFSALVFSKKENEFKNFVRILAVPLVIFLLVKLLLHYC